MVDNDWKSCLVIRNGGYHTLGNRVYGKDIVQCNNPSMGICWRRQILQPS